VTKLKEVEGYGKVEKEKNLSSILHHEEGRDIEEVT